MKKIFILSFMLLVTVPLFSQFPYGVTTENTFISLEQAEARPNQVVCLNLRGKGLSEVPAEVTHYPNMQVLTLMKNNLTIASPLLFANPRLKDLNIRNNTISAFPVSLLTKWDSLEVLNMAFNQFVILPAELGQVTTLKVLQADHNKINTIAPELSQLNKLQFLILNNNQLETIGSWITGMSALCELDLSYNQLKDVSMMQQGTYTELVTLNLSYNKLTSLKLNYKGMPGLKTLAINSNQLTTVPEEITRLQGLETLVLSDNPITHLPKGIGKMKHLKTLILINTSLSEAEKARVRKVLPDCDIRF